ncbi:MAG: ribonuclease III [Gammaproteobacteria bacterium]|nr:ribonuclease III [Gammaproteobacteria bacterium]
MEEKLQQKLGYVFVDDAKLRESLTHRSAGGKHNERLEFLGDSILNFVIAHMLFEKFPKAREGELSRLRASLVKKETLAEIGRNLKLGDFIYLGPGELKSGGFRRDSILADTVEAIMGATYLDGGFEACKTLILGLYEHRLNQITIDRNLKDPKSALQEYLQSRHLPLPVYHVMSISGEPHQQTFEVSCEVEGLSAPCSGQGTSRRRAEQAAAQGALNKLKDQHHDK